MQVDPDQREWLQREEQERLRWKRKLEKQPRTRPQWILIAAAGVILAVVVAVVVSSDMFKDLLSRLGPLNVR
jgi:hypothetical protein